MPAAFMGIRLEFARIHFELFKAEGDVLETFAASSKSFRSFQKDPNASPSRAWPSCERRPGYGVEDCSVALEMISRI
jgi:hypothetical protein